jgi:hypothetical protein
MVCVWYPEVEIGKGKPNWIHASGDPIIDRIGLASSMDA